MPNKNHTKETIKKLTELQSKLAVTQEEIAKNLTKASEGDELNSDDLEILFKEIESIDIVARHERDTTH